MFTSALIPVILWSLLNVEASCKKKITQQEIFNTFFLFFCSKALKLTLTCIRYPISNNGPLTWYRWGSTILVLTHAKCTVTSLYHSLAATFLFIAFRTDMSRTLGCSLHLWSESENNNSKNKTRQSCFWRNSMNNWFSLHQFFLGCDGKKVCKQ